MIESLHGFHVLIGLSNHYYTTQPQPLSPDRFARVTGVSHAESLLIFEKLRRAGMLDAQGRVHANAKIGQLNLAWLNLDPTQLRGLENQLTIVKAGHAVNSADNGATLDFFDLHGQP